MRRFFPPAKLQKEAFQGHLLARFDAKEGIVEYIDRVLDRQINKANGLLAFNGLLFTALSVISSAAGSTPLSIKVGGTLALAASIPLIPIFVVQFGGISAYQTPQKDFESKCKTIYRRTWGIDLSVFLSFFAAAFALLHLWSSN